MRTRNDVAGGGISPANDVVVRVQNVNAYMVGQDFARDVGTNEVVFNNVVSTLENG